MSGEVSIRRPDPVLTAYVEEDKSVEQIIVMGFDKEVVEPAAQLVDESKYKRRQAPPGIKITPRSLRTGQKAANYK